MEDMETVAPMEGDDHLPHSVVGLKFIAARCKELTAMSEYLLGAGKTKLIFQSLPANMRRRVMSHNSKRLPRRLREAHMSQLRKSGLPPVQKRPSRKHRRRARNLLLEYNRRKRSCMWLETHIWHAKRFHMVECWGFKVAQRSCDKTYRSCYRATARHCLIQDVSYDSCIEISGDPNRIIDRFRSITNAKCGLGIGANAYRSGKRAGTVDIFGIDKYPHGFVGRIKYIWISNDNPRLWIFTEASFHKEIITLLTEAFQLSDIKLVALKQSVNRFRLTGPLSHAVLSKSLEPLLASDNETTHTSSWITAYDPKANVAQNLYWNKIRAIASPSELPRGVIVGLLVKDPRLNRPKKRFKATPNENNAVNARDLIDVPDLLNSSALWSHDVRNQISSNKMSVADINKLINECGIVPGEPCKEFNTIQSVPVVLIQNPGSSDITGKNFGYGCGYDLLLPSEYAMPFWISLILCGARPGALKETINSKFEANDIYMYPDSQSYRDEALRVYLEKKERYFKLPPNKRVNYNKMSVSSPFLSRWKELTNEWSGVDGDFYVCRERDSLRRIKTYIQSTHREDFPMNLNCLVAVKISVLGSGRPRQFSLICQPNETDLRNTRAPIEPKRSDRNAAHRNSLRKEHKLKLRSIRRRKVCMKRKAMMTSETPVILPKTKIAETHIEYLAKMQDLWLPAENLQIRKQCSRDVMGFVTHGDFSLSEGRCVGVGFIALPSLLHLVRKPNKKPIVLIRNTNSRQYRLAELEMLIPQ